MNDSLAEGWRTVTVGQLGRVVTGKTPPTKRPDLYGDRYPFITPSDISEQSHICHATRYLSEQGKEFQSNYLLPERAICYTCIASIGKICMTTGPSFTNQQINSIVVDESQHDPRFVYYLLRRETERVKALASGVATPIINKSVFSQIELRVPKLELQHKIAAILSAYDDLIENNLRRIQILEQMAQRLYREWFVHFRFPGHEGVRMVDSPLGPIPAGWQVVKVKTAVERLKAGRVYRKGDRLEHGQVPVVDQSREIIQGFHNKRPDHLATPTRPVIAFGDHTCKMQLMVEPFSVGPNVVPFVSRKGLPTAYLYFAVMGLVETREYKRHWTELMSKQLVLAEGNCVKQFATFIAPMFEQVALLLRKNVTLHRMRDLLLPCLISGEVDVSELDVDIGDPVP